MSELSTDIQGHPSWRKRGRLQELPGKNFPKNKQSSHRRHLEYKFLVSNDKTN